MLAQVAAVATPRPTLSFGLTWGHVALVLLPIGAFLGCELLLGLLAQRPVTTAVLPPAGRSWPEASARVQILSAMVLFFVLSIGVAAKVVGDLALLVARPSLLRLAAVFGLCALVGGGLLSAVGSALPHTRDLLDRGVFDAALTAGAASGGTSRWGADAYPGIVRITNAVALLAVSALITGGFSCLAALSPRDEPDRLAGRTPDEAAEAWRWQASRLRLYVYLSAALMIVGVFYAKALTEYPAFVLGEADQKAYLRLANALTTYTGVQYSVVLAGYALPVAGILAVRAYAIAEAKAAEIPGPHTDLAVEAVRKAEGLVMTPGEVLRSIAALVAPFLAGTVASLPGLGVPA